MGRRKAARHPRPLWQHVLRGAALVAVFLAAAYVTLPWWLPADVVRGYLADDLSRSLGLKVTIGSLRLRWSDGLELSDVKVANPPAFGPGDLLEVAHVRADLSPLRYVVRRQLAWMEVDRARLHVQVDPAGNLNLGAISKFSSDVQTERISIRGASVFLQLPDQDRRLEFQVRDVQVVAGRVQSLGRVTMSAALAQQGGEAPVGLAMAAGASESPVAASGSFNFSNLDLAQIPLQGLVRLPFRKLGGRCSGMLDLQVNRQGVVDRFSFSLFIKRLDVQPSSGLELPVVDEAGIRIAATYDPLGEQLDLQSVSLVLPGVDLSGKAVVYTGAGASWEAVNLLDLQGELNPGQLAALLTGHEVLPGELAVQGPVGISFVSQRQGGVLGLRFVADATAATLRQGGRTLKPAGRTLQVEAVGAVDWRSWRFSADQTRLVLGANSFVGRGTLQNIHQLTEHWLADQRQHLATRSVVSDLSNLNWEGSWEINEPAPLGEILGAAADRLPRIDLKGQLRGGWSIERSNGLQLEIRSTVPPEAELSIAGVFVKPRGQALTMTLMGKIDEAQAGLSGVDLDVTVGDQARVSLDAGYVHMIGSGAAAELEAGAKIDADHLEGVQACLPGAGAGPVGVEGGFSGRCIARLGPKAFRVHVSGDLRDMGLSWGGGSIKPAGQPAQIEADWLWDATAASASDYLAVRWDSPPVNLQTTVVFPASGQAGAQPTEVNTRLNLKDAAWLAQAFPGIEEALGGGRLGGSARLEARTLWRPGTVEAAVLFDGDALDCTLGDGVVRTKRAGVPLRLRLDATARRQSDRSVVADVRLAAFDLAKSSTRLSGQAVFQPASGDLPVSLYPPPNLRQFEFSFESQCGLDASLGELAPELGRCMRDYDLSGLAKVQGILRGTEDRLHFTAHLDARDLGAGRLVVTREAASPPPTVPTAKRAGAAAAGATPVGIVAAGVAPVGTAPAVEKVALIKPTGMPAWADIEVTLLPKLSRIVLNNLKARVGDVEILADASATYPSTGAALDGVFLQKAAHISAWTTRMESLATMVPSLAPYRLAGQARLETEINDADGGCVPYLRLGAKDLQVAWRGKTVRLQGDVLLENLRPSPRCRGMSAEQLARAFESDPSRAFELGRLHTEMLEFRVGANHGWVLADLTGIPAAPAGTLQLLGEFLDAKDLADWTDDESLRVLPARGKLLPEHIQYLSGKAKKSIQALRPWVLASKIDAQISLKSVRGYDAAVQEPYDVDNLVGEVSVDHGRVNILYQGGLSGGLYKVRQELNFKDANPYAACQTLLKDAVATKSIQPQLSRFFPGNTVHGFFNREESLMVPLEGYFAESIDSRYPSHSVGSAKTITIDGVTVGQAAPDFVVRIFPGLNLAEYPYRKMTAFAEFLPDGSAQNDMVFDGQAYDIYMEGSTDPTNVGRYEIGLILLGSPQSAEWNHTYRQGRVPILKFKARIEDGRMLDVEVSFPWPNETLGAIFLRNNIFYRLWLNAGRK